MGDDMTVETAASTSQQPEPTETTDWQPVEAATEDLASTLDEPGEVFEPDDDYRAFSPRPRLMSPLTWVLLFALTASAGFLVGAKLQHRSAARSSTATAGEAFAAAAAARGGFGGAAAGTGAASAATTRAATPSATGTVKLVDGTNLYIADAQGNIVKVAVGAGVSVVVTRPATLTDLAVGQTVTVEGISGADGTLQATLVTGVAPAGAATAAPTAASTTP
jgi:hypothetical protein